MTSSAGYPGVPYLDGVKLANPCGCGECKKDEIYNFKNNCRCPHCKNVHPHPVPMWTMTDINGNPVGPHPPALGPYYNPDNFTFTGLKNMTQRKYLPTLSELIDRLSITQLKEVFIPEHREEYAQEIADIMHDIDIAAHEDDDYIGKQLVLDAETVRAIIVLAQMNLHIWHNESNFRKGIKDGNDLELTHGLNGIRNTAKNKIQSTIGGRKDYKVDNVEAFKEWVPSGWGEDE